MEKTNPRYQSNVGEELCHVCQNKSFCAPHLVGGIIAVKCENFYRNKTTEEVS